MKQFVYLSGPMMGYTHSDVNDWRVDAIESLDNEHVKCLSPMRTWTDEFLPNETDKWINRRDYFDCTRASCVLVNITMMKHVSIGTIMEIAWAYQAQIPVICVCNEDGPQKHPMLRDSITHEVYTLEEGIAFVKELLSEN